MRPDFRSFGDELTKIAFFKALKNHLTSSLSAGWNGTKENPIATLPGKGWFGTGPLITPEMGSGGRAFEHITSLGGLTRYLPVGAKSLTLLGAGLEAKDAIPAQDPTGLGRSRTERVMGAAGSALGGIVGAGALMKHMPHSLVMAPLVGGTIGASLGSAAFAEPWKAARMRQLHQQQLMAQRAGMRPSQPQPQPVPQYPTNGVPGVAQ